MNCSSTYKTMSTYNKNRPFRPRKDYRCCKSCFTDTKCVDKSQKIIVKTQYGSNMQVHNMNHMM